MRLIDTDGLSFKTIIPTGDTQYDLGREHGIDFVREMLADAPTIDAIPVDVLKKLAIEVCATEDKIDQEILQDMISAIINAVIDA